MSTTHKHETARLSPLAFPSAAVVKRNRVEYGRNARVFSQGDASKDVLYIQHGGVRLSVVNEVGKEAVIAILGLCRRRLHVRAAFSYVYSDCDYGDECTRN